MNNEPKRVYLAGKMRGVKDFNFPAFHAAAADLRRAGYDVFNPAEHDEGKHGKGFQRSETGDLNDIAHTAFNLRQTLKEDLSWIADNADYIAVLPGWEESKGASAEVALARAIGIEVIRIVGMDGPPPFISNGVSDLRMQAGRLSEVTCPGEQRITNAATGGQKGVKLERFDLIPAEPLEELARVYGRGAKKYQDDNWRKGYSWKLSFGAMMRHAWAFWRGESHDELGNHHLACAAWHCFTLMWYEQNRKSLDDRPKSNPQ